MYIVCARQEWSHRIFFRYMRSQMNEAHTHIEFNDENIISMFIFNLCASSRANKVEKI